MRTKEFLGMNKNLYRFIDCETLEYKDYTFNGVAVLFRNRELINCGIDRDNQFYTDDGLVYGLESDNKNECRNTYTIIGDILGYYIICDFYGKIFVLTEKEINLNKDLFTGKLFTNFLLRLNLQSRSYGVEVLNIGFYDMVTYASICNDRDICKRTFKYILRVLELRKETINDANYKKHKVNEFNIKVIDSNILEINKILKDDNANYREMLYRYSRNLTELNKGLLEKFFMNKALYPEDINK